MSKNEVSFAVTDEYKSWIDDIKKRIRQAQIKAAIKVNYELLDLYWELGKDIVKKQESTKWGDAFLKTMSKDLQKSFPDLSGLSPQNLKHIRYWYKFYSQGGIGLQAVTQLEDGSGDVPVEPTLQEIEKLIKSIPWGHNQRIMYKCKSILLLKKLDEMYPKDDIIRIVCDNHSAHKSKETRNYLSTLLEGRFVFVFTPKHGSWLNLVESFFSKMTKQMLKGIRVQSKQELEERIYLHFDEVNKEPVVYHWTYKLDEISPEEAESAGIKSNEDIDI